MSYRNRTSRSLVGLLGAALLAAPQLASAQWGAPPQQRRSGDQQRQQLVFEWEGRVDRETQIAVSGDRRTVRGVDGDESRGRFRSTSALPSNADGLRVEVVDGRGQVDVLQQPGSGRRGDAGVIRIRDPQGGAGTYRIRVYALTDDRSYGRNDRGNGNDGRTDRTDRTDRNDRNDDGRWSRSSRAGW